MKYAKEKTKISKDLRDKKEELSVRDAKLRKTIISLSEKKPTVAEVDAEIALDEKHRKLTSEITVLEYDFDLLKECINGLRVKENSLREERELLALGYWSRTSKTQGIRTIQADAANQETRDKVNRKRRERA